MDNYSLVRHSGEEDALNNLLKEIENFVPNQKYEEYKEQHWYTIKSIYDDVLQRTGRSPALNDIVDTIFCRFYEKYTEMIKEYYFKYEVYDNLKYVLFESDIDEILYNHGTDFFKNNPFDPENKNMLDILMEDNQAVKEWVSEDCIGFTDVMTESYTDDISPIYISELLEEKGCAVIIPPGFIKNQSCSLRLQSNILTYQENQGVRNFLTKGNSQALLFDLSKNITLYMEHESVQEDEIKSSIKRLSANNYH